MYSDQISLIRVHSVCFYYDKINSVVHLIICSRHNKQITFSGQKYWKAIRANVFLSVPVLYVQGPVTSNIFCRTYFVNTV